jgi:hypothetical protein
VGYENSPSSVGFKISPNAGHTKEYYAATFISELTPLTTWQQPNGIGVFVLEMLSEDATKPYQATGVDSDHTPFIVGGNSYGDGSWIGSREATHWAPLSGSTDPVKGQTSLTVSVVLETDSWYAFVFKVYYANAGVSMAWGQNVTGSLQLLTGLTE